MHVVWTWSVIVALLFGAMGIGAVWLFMLLLTLVMRGVGALLRGSRRSSTRLTIGTLCCPRRGCQALNPTSANFCRRCGQRLARHGPGKRAAFG